jgi:ABC-type multidrug transport system fused ATPase/permease subunit
LQVVGGIIILFYVAPLLTLVMLAPMPVLGIGAAIYGRDSCFLFECRSSLGLSAALPLLVGRYVKTLSGEVQTALAATTGVRSFLRKLGNRTPR